MPKQVTQGTTGAKPKPSRAEGRQEGGVATMPQDEGIPVVSFDDLSEYMERCVNHLTDMSIVTRLVAQFFGVATPEEVSLLMNCLSERVGRPDYPSKQTLQECMLHQVEAKPIRKAKEKTL